jgi:triphosphatase
VKKKTDAHPVEPRETELKLLVAPADAAAVRRHPFLRLHAIAPPRTQQLTSTYYDTPDLRLRHGGASLRLRTLENGWVQTFKNGADSHGGLHDRAEWELPVTTASLDLPALRESVGRKTHWGKVLGTLDDGDALQPVFDTCVKRTTWALHLSDGVEIEVALDQGAIDHDDRHTRISEIELELKSGDVASLYRVAQELAASVPLRLGNLSKAERGYRLCFPDDAIPAVRKAEPIALTPRMTLREGFQAIVAECLAQVDANASGVGSGDDPEHVHQMRVGLRRLHCALQLFAPIAPVPARFEKDLAWLGERLGAARDWEVLGLATLPQIQRRAAGEAGIDTASLAQAAFDRANTARRKAAAAIASPRYARLILSFSGWMHEACAPASVASLPLVDEAPSLHRFADTVLAKARKRLVKRAGLADAADEALLHRVRIAAKKSRYATEFFRALFAQDAVDAYLEKLEALQESLGAMNDRTVAGRLLHELASTEAGLEPASAYARGYLAAESVRAALEIGKIDALVPAH